MNFLSQVGHWLTTSANWSGPDGIVHRAVAQVELSVLVVVAAGIVGIGLGFMLGRGRHGGFVAINAANAARAVPSLALLTLLVTWPAVGFRASGFDASFLTLFALGIPPLLTNSYVGMREVDADVVEAAKASGMTSLQRFWKVEVPLAAPLAITGLRIAAVEVVATSTLAAYVSYNDLGVFIFAGLDTNNGVESFGGALIVAVLAGLSDLVILALYRLVTPVPLRRAGASLAGATKTQDAGVATFSDNALRRVSQQEPGAATDRPALARRLADLTRALSYDDLPASTRTVAKAHVLDALACMVSGVSTPAFRATKRYLGLAGRLDAASAEDQGRVGDLVPEHGARPDVESAAMLIGTPAFIDNYGDTSLYSVTHPNTVIVPAALVAARERVVDGREFLTAVATGYQVTEFLARSLNNGSPRMAHQVRGFRPTATCGPAGAAAAAGRIWSLGADELSAALGISANLAAGLRRTDAGPLAHMRLHSGEAVRRGIQAVLLANAGVRVEERILEGPGGFLEAMRNGELDPGAAAYLTSPLHFALDDVALKLHATPHTLAPTLDCLRELVAAEPDLATRAEAVRVYLPAAHAAISAEAAAADVAALDSVDALDHLRFAAAVVLMSGELVLPRTPDRFLGRADVVALADRVTLVVDPAEDRRFATIQGSWPAHVEVDTPTGMRRAERLRPDGAELDAPTRRALGEKFEALCADALGASSRHRVVDLVDHLEMSEDVFGELRGALLDRQARAAQTGGSRSYWI